jgi:hypothetical protein
MSHLPANPSSAFIRRNPHLYGNQNRGKVSDSKPERDATPALVSPATGEEACLGGTVVRFTGYRVRPVDPDSFAGSCKHLLDGLRHAGLIPGDEPWRITLETKQVRVSSFKEEQTVIEIIFP